MMRGWLSVCAVCLALSGPVSGGPAEDNVIRQLSEQGFNQIEVSRTWLGRSRIVSRRGDMVREIIINPLTGEILRDYWRTRSRGEGQTLFNPPSGEAGGGEAGKNDDDDDYDDDYREDYDDDDDDDRDDDDRDGDDGDGDSDSDGGDSDGDDGDDD
ncbi:MAG: hypothetical protein ABJ263_08465 [Tateyamaria sp.]|uniref:hypothetical protein n=1 Tax=Tateyamaria sp. TaxID=1929288 RepID=UPI003273387E